MPESKLNNRQLPDVIQNKTIDTSNDIDTTTTKLTISGGTNGQVLSTDGSGNLSWASGVAAPMPDGDYGDIIVSNTGGTWTIDANAVDANKLDTNAVTTSKIADSNVTFAKIQNFTANTVLGRGVNNGVSSLLSVANGLRINGGTLELAANDSSNWRQLSYQVSQTTISAGYSAYLSHTITAGVWLIMGTVNAAMNNAKFSVHCAITAASTIIAESGTTCEASGSAGNWNHTNVNVQAIYVATGSTSIALRIRGGNSLPYSTNQPTIFDGTISNNVSSGSDRGTMLQSIRLV